MAMSPAELRAGLRLPVAIVRRFLGSTCAIQATEQRAATLLLAHRLRSVSGVSSGECEPPIAGERNSIPTQSPPTMLGAMLGAMAGAGSVSRERGGNVSACSVHHVASRTIAH